ncbi:hypothetical protein BB560_004323 [Smittium megazygosporum]|uniref:PX domain-containing protein n=1 Tax=Smittium megazygosporum TaxID=133381 RepID=A0A2T9Z9J8_9FUNG|nr:hypothetical protein BB560_004323 [Smittium megazygosporum]
MHEIGERNCCIIEQILYLALQQTLQQSEHLEENGIDYRSKIIFISKAEQVTNGGSTYVAYTITYGKNSVVRRYSEFGSLRKILSRLYPTFVIPVIPEKHSFAQYAPGRKNLKSDHTLINKRKRILGRFLGRIVENPILSTNHIFHLFLDKNVAWTEVVNIPMMANLPSNPLYSSPSKAAGSSLYLENFGHFPKIAATNSFAKDIPLPGPLTPLVNSNPQWTASKCFTNKFANIWSTKIYENFQKIDKKFKDLSDIYGELGSIFNGLSLLEGNDVLKAVEYSGQAFDNMSTLQMQMKSKFELGVLDYIYEYLQFSGPVNDVLSYRAFKNAQLELLSSKLEQRRQELQNLVNLEHDDHGSDGSENASTSQSNPNNTLKGISNSIAAAVKTNLNDRNDQIDHQKHSKSQIENDFENSSTINETLSVKDNVGLAIGFEHNRNINLFRDDPNVDPLSQLQLEQSMIWDNSFPSALPGENFSYNEFQDKNKAFGNPQSEIGGPSYRHFGDDLSKTNSYTGTYIHQPAEFSASRVENSNTVEQNEQVSSQPSGSKSHSMIATKSDPVRHTSKQSESLFNKQKVLGGSILTRISSSFNSIVDANNDVSKKVKIDSLVGTISELEENSEMISDDLTLINESSQENLDRFQKSKIHDFKIMLISLANIQIESNNLMLEQWKKTRRIIEEVNDQGY